MRFKCGSIAYGIVVIIIMLTGCGSWQSNGTTKNSTSINGEKPFSNSTSSTPDAPSSKTLSNLTSIHMVNAMTGWALSQDSLLRTVDGGVSWTNVTPKGVESMREGTTLSVYDAQTIWVVFNKDLSTTITAYRTTDGGQKWESTEINTTPYYGRVTSLDFIDLTHGWLLASYDVSMGSESVEVFQTNDGGASWKSNASAIINEKTSNDLPLAGSKNGLVFLNQKNGWLTGFSHGDGIWLYSSSDGGRTWSQKTIVAPQGFHTEGGSVSIEPPHFFNQKEGVLPVEFRGENPPAFVFYRTEDGGLSWTPTTPVQTVRSH